MDANKSSLPAAVSEMPGVESLTNRAAMHNGQRTARVLAAEVPLGGSGETASAAPTPGLASKPGRAEASPESAKVS